MAANSSQPNANMTSNPRGESRCPVNREWVKEKRNQVEKKAKFCSRLVKHRVVVNRSANISAWREQDPKFFLMKL